MIWLYNDDISMWDQIETRWWVENTIKIKQMNFLKTPNDDFNEQWYNQFNCPTQKLNQAKFRKLYIEHKITPTKNKFLSNFN